MLLPVHYLVARKMNSAQDKNILYSLSVVHAQSRIFFYDFYFILFEIVFINL